jgi:hypothetical protein
MSRVAIGMWFALAVCASAYCVAAPRGQTDTTFPLRLEHGSRLTIAAKINGRLVEALLDSAAETTILDKTWARHLPLSPGTAVSGQGSGKDPFDAQLVTGVVLEAVGLRLENQTVAVADLSDVAHRLLHHRLDVILGREIFDAARLAIDIEGGHISVVNRTRQPPGIRIPLVTEHGVESIEVRVESGDPVHATFDLGNGSQLLIGQAYAQRMRFLSDGREVGEERGGGLGGELVRKVFRIKSLEVAGSQLKNVAASIDPNPTASDVNIGVSILRHFRITTDFSEGAVWLEARN